MKGPLFRSIQMESISLRITDAACDLKQCFPPDPCAQTLKNIYLHFIIHCNRTRPILSTVLSACNLLNTNVKNLSLKVHFEPFTGGEHHYILKHIVPILLSCFPNLEAFHLELKHGLLVEELELVHRETLFSQLRMSIKKLCFEVWCHSGTDYILNDTQVGIIKCVRAEKVIIIRHNPWDPSFCRNKQFMLLSPNIKFCIVNSYERKYSDFNIISIAMLENCMEMADFIFKFRHREYPNIRMDLSHVCMKKIDTSVDLTKNISFYSTWNLHQFLTPPTTYCTKEVL